MKRWNGWGNVDTGYPLPAKGLDYLAACLGNLEPQQDAARETILASILPARLPAHPMIDTSPDARLRHARGQSLPDWVALKTGRIGTFPDGVAFPPSPDAVTELLQFARKHFINVIPYGGGTSVVGHINPLPGDKPVLTLSMERQEKLLELDETSRLANFETGVTGPHLELQLNQRGYTLGHFPQSFEYSTLGGWVATRSSGQQSYYYGRIEDLFAGGSLETTTGRLVLPALPASAAGPDLRQLVLGSEGRLGVLTQARVRVRPLPEAQFFVGVFFPTWEQGVQAVRHAVQKGLAVSMLRLSNPLETEINLTLAGKSWLPLAERGLGLLGYGAHRCILIAGLTGRRADVRRTRQALIALVRRFGGLYTGSLAGHTWEKSRFLSPYLRNTLWEAGVAVDTLETALPWSQVLAAAAAIPASIEAAARAYAEPVLAFAHLSHVYVDGASIYTTVLFRCTRDPDELLARWKAMKQAASQVIQQCGGTISHQHGVGLDHTSYLAAEKGALGIDALGAMCSTFDPQGIFNPGKLLPE